MVYLRLGLSPDRVLGCRLKFGQSVYSSQLGTVDESTWRSCMHAMLVLGVQRSSERVSSEGARVDSSGSSQLEWFESTRPEWRFGTGNSSWLEHKRADSDDGSQF